MQEGLVLLDEKGTVLSINHAACRLFQADDGCVGRDFLTVDRSHELSLALETARKRATANCAASAMAGSTRWI